MFTLRAEWRKHSRFNINSAVDLERALSRDFLRKAQAHFEYIASFQCRDNGLTGTICNPLFRACHPPVFLQTLPESVVIT